MTESTGAEQIRSPRNGVDGQPQWTRFFAMVDDNSIDSWSELATVALSLGQSSDIENRAKREPASTASKRHGSSAGFQDSLQPLHPLRYDLSCKRWCGLSSNCWLFRREIHATERLQAVPPIRRAIVAVIRPGP